MLDVNELEKNYEKYCELERKYNEYQEKIDKGLQELVNYIEGKPDDKEIIKFKEENKDVKRVNLYREKREDTNDEMNRILKSYFSKYSQFVLVNDNNKELLMDLKYLERFDITNINTNLKEFIIKMLETQNIYIGKIDINDLPLLMEIKEDVELPYVDKQNLPFEEEIEEKSSYESSICSKIRKSYKKAINIRKLIDTKQGSKLPSPFIYKSEDVLRAWNEFDDKKLKNGEYWIEYYKLLIKFGNNVEKLYNEAEESIKRYVIIAYQIIVKESDIRTQSPLINEKVLMKIFNNKK